MATVGRLGQQQLICFHLYRIVTGKLSNSSTDLVIESLVSDRDMVFKGNDGGSTVTALTLDMSAAGAATLTIL